MIFITIASADSILIGAKERSKSMAWYNYEDAILLTEEEFQEGCCNCSAHCAEGTISVPCDGDRGECPFYGELESDAYDKEIRAKAIEEFAEKLKESMEKKYRHLIDVDRDGFERLTTEAVETHIDETVKELKGE